MRDANSAIAESFINAFPTLVKEIVCRCKYFLAVVGMGSVMFSKIPLECLSVLMVRESNRP